MYAREIAVSSTEFRFRVQVQGGQLSSHRREQASLQATDDVCLYRSHPQRNLPPGTIATMQDNYQSLGPPHGNLSDTRGFQFIRDEVVPELLPGYFGVSWMLLH